MVCLVEQGAEIPPLVKHFRYCGEYFDEETGLIYLRNRYYDPSIGAFINEDPVRDGLNWYSYCSGNPVAFVDPWGLLTGDAVETIQKLETLKYLKQQYAATQAEDSDLRESYTKQAQEIRDWILSQSPLMEYAAFNAYATEYLSDSTKNTMLSTDALIKIATYTAPNYYAEHPNERIYDKNYTNETNMVENYKKEEDYLSRNPIYALKFDGISFWNREYIIGVGAVKTWYNDDSKGHKFIPIPKRKIEEYYYFEITRYEIVDKANTSEFDPNIIDSIGD